MWHFLRWVHSSQTKFRPSRCWSTNYMISSSTAKFRPYPLFAKFFNQYDFYSLWFSWMNLSTYEIKVLTIDFQDFSSLCLNNLHRKIFYFWLAMRNVVSSIKLFSRSFSSFAAAKNGGLVQFCRPFKITCAYLFKLALEITTSSTFWSQQC